MKIFKKHVKKVNPIHVMAWAVVKLEDGSIKLPKTNIDFAVLVGNRFREGDSKVEWTRDGEEWYSVTPNEWDVYWLI